MASITLVVRNPTPDEARIHELLRESTTRKDEKNYDAAIACLREAYRLMAHVATAWPYKDWFRLPRCLCLAGRFDAAIAELQQLHDGLADYEARRKQAGFIPMPKAVQVNIRRLVKNEIATTRAREMKPQARSAKSPI